MGEATQSAGTLSPKVQQVLDLVSGMTLMESAELVKAFEVKFGVSAAPVAAAAAPVAAAAAAAATPVVKTAAPPAAAAIGAWTRFIDRYRTPLDWLTVESGNGRLGFFLLGHLDKTEASRLAREFVHYDCNRGYLTELGEGLLDILLRRLVRQVSDIDIHPSPFLSAFLLPVSSRSRRTDVNSERMTKGMSFYLLGLKVKRQNNHIGRAERDYWAGIGQYLCGV